MRASPPLAVVAAAGFLFAACSTPDPADVALSADSTVVQSADAAGDVPPAPAAVLEVQASAATGPAADVSADATMVETLPAPTTNPGETAATTTETSAAASQTTGTPAGASSTTAAPTTVTPSSTTTAAPTSTAAPTTTMTAPPTTTAPPTATAPPTTAAGVENRPELLRLALPAYGGGSFDPNSVAGKHVVLWFWGAH